MKRTLATLCLAFAVLLGSAGVSWSSDFQKGLATYDTFTGSHPADGGGAGMAATSAGRVQASALVQGRGLVLAQAG